MARDIVEHHHPEFDRDTLIRAQQIRDNRTRMSAVKKFEVKQRKISEKAIGKVRVPTKKRKSSRRR